MKRAATVKKILDALARRYPKGAKPWMTRSDPFRTTIATILSAQTTDDQVDRVTPELFRRYPTSAKLAAARVRDVERIIKPVGLHQAKARNIVAAGRILVEEFGGKVPKSREELVRLPGVGRKTANVVLIKAFGLPAMPVDTHVFRVATRIGLAQRRGAGNASKASNATNASRKLTPEIVERQLERIIPRRRLGAAHFWLIHHGRTICSARSPMCRSCPIAPWCDYYKDA